MQSNIASWRPFNTLDVEFDCCLGGLYGMRKVNVFGTFLEEVLPLSYRTLSATKVDSFDG